MALLSGGPHGAFLTPGDRKNRSKPTRGRKKVFEAYMSKEDVSAGLKRKTLLQVRGTEEDDKFDLKRTSGVPGVEVNFCLGILSWKQGFGSPRAVSLDLKAANISQMTDRSKEIPEYS